MEANFSVIIPSKNINNLLACVQSVLECEPELPHERIIVVDDGLQWDAYSAERLMGVSITMGQKPFIFSRNINIGILKAGKPDGYVLLNDDAMLKTPGGFSLLAKETEAHPEYGIIGATTNLTGQPLQRPQGIGLRTVPELAYVCVYIPRRTIDQIGMLDERYAIDYGVEDKDHCEACKRAGLKVGVHDGCYVDHGSLVSSFRGDPKVPKSFQQNLKLFNEKWGYRTVGR